MKVFLVIVFSLILGYVIYSFLPFKFTYNCQYIMDLLNNESIDIRHRLAINDNLTNEEKTCLINREKEINNTLNKFYGK